MHGFEIWDRLWSSLCSTRSRLRFTWIAARSNPASKKAAPGQVWPMPLPFPEAHSSKVSPSSLEKLGVNYVVLCLNFLFGQGRFWKNTCPGLGTALNAKQWELAERIRKQVVIWNQEPPISAEEMGRSAAKVQSTEELIASLHEELLLQDKMGGKNYSKPASPPLPSGGQWKSSPGEVVGVSHHVPAHLAKPVEADRLKFWKTPSFDASPYLDYKMRAIFERPLDYASEEYEAFSPPRVSVRCSAREKLKLLEALDGSQRLQLVPASVVRMKFRNGLFAIPKDGARDRMVLDARPPNMLEDPSCPWIRTLASVSQLNHLFMEDDEEMRLFAEDLREFYHAFLIAPQRVLRNALACQVDPREVSHLGCFHDGLWGQGSLVPCLGTMAMGDCHAVSFGQIAHLSVLLRSGAVSLDDFLMLHSRPSRKEWVAGLMIDDLVLLERRVRAGEPDVDCLSRPPTTCEKIIEEVRRQYEEVGLPRHEGKAVYNSLEGTFWGVQLDGRRGDVRPSLKRSIPLAFIIQRVVRLRRATVGLLELIAGSLVAVFQTHMSILEGIYDAQRGRERGDVVALSPELCDELLVAVALIPLAFIDLRLKASPDLVASDASSTSEAAVVCDVGPTATGELHRHTLQKGLWNRLLSPVQAYMREKDLLDACEELPDDTFEGLYGMHPVGKRL